MNDPTISDFFAHLEPLKEKLARAIEQDKKELRRAQAIACGAIAPNNKTEDYIVHLSKQLDAARKQLDAAQAEIEQLREQIATAASAAAGLRLAAHTACISIRAVVDEIEINRIMTHEERRWSRRLEKIARNLDPYPEHDE